MKIKIVGFDLDGTLYPNTPAIQEKIRNKIYEKICSNFGLDFETAKSSFEKKYSRLSSGSRAISEIARELGREDIGSDIAQEALQESDFLNLIEKNPELNYMLNRLAGNKRLDLITSSKYDFALQKLQRIGISPGLFSYIFPAEDGSKSSGELYRKWIEAENFSPRQHLYVGDNTKQDIEVPKKLKIKTCFVGGRNSKADFFIKNILDLEKLVLSL